MESSNTYHVVVVPRPVVLHSGVQFRVMIVASYIVSRFPSNPFLFKACVSHVQTPTSVAPVSSSSWHIIACIKIRGFRMRGESSASHCCAIRCTSGGTRYRCWCLEGTGRGRYRDATPCVGDWLSYNRGGCPIPKIRYVDGVPSGHAFKTIESHTMSTLSHGTFHPL